jgi:hypothetical protein
MKAWNGDSGPLAPACAGRDQRAGRVLEARDLDEAEPDRQEEADAEQERHQRVGSEDVVRCPDDGGADAVRQGGQGLGHERAS